MSAFIVIAAQGRHHIAELVGGTGEAIATGVSWKAAKTARKWIRKHHGAGSVVGLIWEPIRLRSLERGHSVAVRQIR